MPSLTFTISIGDHEAAVQLKEFKGEKDTYQIYIDKYYHGVLKKREWVWWPLVNPNSWIQRVDAQLMGEMVDDGKA